MSRRAPPEPVETVRQRRDTALRTLCASIPVIAFMGIDFDRRGDEVTGVMRYDAKLIGNPGLPALHGGATATFLELTAQIELCFQLLWDDVEAGRLDPVSLAGFRWPKTIGFTVDYLRPGLPRDAFARARVNRSGRRYASVHVETWQDHRDKLFAQATAHFRMPPAGEA